MITVVLVALAVAVQAQFAVGGQFGFNMSGSRFIPNNGDDVKAPRTTNFSIAPMVAYNLGDGLILGIHPEFFRNNAIRDFNFDGNSDRVTATTGFGLDVFALYTYMSFGRLNLLAKPSIGFTTSNRNRRIGSGDTEHLSRTNTFGFGITPVVDFHVNERIMLIARFNFLSLGFTRQGTRAGLPNGELSDDRTVTNTFGFRFNSNDIISLGGTTGLTIGFLYKL